MPYSSYLLNLYGCSVVTLLTSLLLQWSLKCLWDHPRVATIISLWMSWKNSRVYASVISRDGSRKSRSDNALLQVLEKKDFSTLTLPSNNEKTQRFVMMSWTRVHLGVWPKSALLTPPHNIMRINQLQLPRDLRKICLAIIGQHLASTTYESRSLDFFYDFDEIPLGFTAAKQKKNNALSACD